MKTAPDINQAEITLLGTGGGYGECIVGHLGKNNWIVIDSCVNPVTKESLAIEYFKEIGVNIETDVKLIVCTHWHDDHIKGISEIFKLAKESSIAFLRIHDRRNFSRLISFDINKNETFSDNVSTREMYSILEILACRKMPPKYASVDRVLLNLNLDSNPINVIALSPSDQSVLNFDKEMAILINDFSYSNLKIVPENPNSKSVVILIQFPFHAVLLGSDLEVKTDQNVGWMGILNFSEYRNVKSSYFKISHHGSDNAHHDLIWSQMLHQRPTATIAPWNRKSKIPKVEMLNMFCEKSDKIYMTSPVLDSKPKKRSKEEQMMIEKLGYKLSEIKFLKGTIQSRINFLDQEAIWETKTFENAFHVNL